MGDKILLNLLNRKARNKNEDDNEDPSYSIGMSSETQFSEGFNIDVDFKEILKQNVKFIKIAYKEAKFNNNNTNSSDEIDGAFDIINEFIENYKNNNNFYSDIKLTQNTIPLKFNCYRYQNKLILWYLSNRIGNDKYDDTRGMIYVDIEINNNEVKMNMMIFDITFFGSNIRGNNRKRTISEIADDDIFTFLHNNSTLDIKNENCNTDNDTDND